MKLFYSPFFTGECYRDIPLNEPRFEKVAGDAALLDFLELRLGLAGSESNSIDRILAYRDALRAKVQDAFYEEAFKNDSLATAKEILHWRDLLVMEGFDADITYKTPRLQKLAEVDREFCKSGLVGTPERWKLVREHARGAFPGVVVEVCHDIDLLPKLIRNTLSSIGVTRGRYDGLGKTEPIWNPVGRDITIRQFGTVADAYKWAADNNDCKAVICPDPFRLNAVLRNKEMALLDASASGDSSITQLFRLGLSLLQRPVNVKNLLEYLRLGFSPIPGKPRYSLAFALKSEGGRGEKWMKDLEECDEKADVEKYLLSLLDADVKDGMVASTTVIDWCKAVADWTKEVRTEEKLPYLMGLSDLCNGMCRIVESELSDKVSVGFIEKAVKALYTPTPVQNIKAKAGCWSASASHRLFIDAPESLMWLPCNGGLETAYPYSFMLQEEAREMDVKEMSDYVKFDFNLLVQLLGQVKKIELCACDFDCTDALEEHPAVTLCKPAAEQKDMRETDNRSAIFTPLRTIETGVDLYPKRKGESGKETGEDISLSASSIETLIGYPFDFVMDKKLGFKDLSSLQLSELIPTQGTVAHYVFEKMLEDNEEGKKPMRDMLEESSFAERVGQAARERGEILFQPEYRTLYSNYKDTIRKSIGVLLDILDKSGLTPKKSEFKLDQDLDFSHITGSVDFYAETNSGDVVVIDFKYSKGRTYIDKLDEDKSIQLEIYAETLQKMLKKTVVAKGYYFFPINQLHTDDEHGFFKGPGVIQHKKQASSFTLEERIKNSVNRRKEELKAGKLEMEEGALLEEIDYHNSASDGSMIDLPAKDKKKKASPFANPTKYPILKDFIR